MTKAKKPDLSMSLDDIITAEKKSKKKKPKSKARAIMGPPKNIDFELYTDDHIRQQLLARGLSTKGQRKKLLNRLKTEMHKAWAAYKKENPGMAFPIFPTTVSKPKKKLSDEEKEAIRKQNEANRLAKAKRRAENIKVQEENQRRKRLKREESAARQAQVEAQQKIQKENRQKCEVHVQFDLEEFKKAMRKKLDPSGKKISNLTQDFSKKGFVVKYHDPKDASKASQGSTMKKKKTIRMPLSAVILPCPLESRCVFFQYPLDQTHPQLAAANKWTLTQNSDENLAELKKLEIWKDSAAKQFAKYGTIINVYRERGFLVVHFTEEASATKFLSKGESTKFNGVAFNFLRSGTPTRAHRLECLQLTRVKKE